MTISDRFLHFIEAREGFKATAYRDSGGVWTIGFGHVIKPGEEHLRDVVLSREDALLLLHDDYSEAQAAVNRLVKVPLRQEQFDALVSFTFNVGQGALAQSTLLRKLNSGHCCAVPDELRKFVYDNGRKVAGLIARRQAEIDLYTGST